MKKTMKMRVMTIAMLVAVPLVGAGAQADILAEYLDSYGNATLYWGQSVTTGSDGTWDHIQFNLYYDGSPVASDTLYLYTQEARVAPITLGPPGEGVLAASTGIVDNVWQFDDDVTLQANTQYWFYTGSSLTARFKTPGSYDDGQVYYSSSLESYFSSLPAYDLLFTLQGTQVGAGGEPVPYPVYAALVCLYQPTAPDKELLLRGF